MQNDKPIQNRFRKLVPAQTPYQARQAVPLVLFPFAKRQSERHGHGGQQPAINRNSVQQRSVEEEDREEMVENRLWGRRLRTISSLVEPEPVPKKYADQFSDHRLKRTIERNLQRQKESRDALRYRQMRTLVSQFEIRSQQIIEMDQSQYFRLSLPSPPASEGSEQEQQFGELQNRTQESSARLMGVYLGRWVAKVRRRCLRQLEAYQQGEIGEEEDYLTSDIPVGPPSGVSRAIRPARDNLFSVHKFLSSK